MSIGDLFWLFFIFSAIQPMLQQKMLEAMRLRKISQLERERKSRVILLVHRQETMRFLGFPVARYIDINDSEEVLRAIQMTDENVPLDLVLHTPGGLVLAALQIAKAVREHKGKVTVFVPHYAMSGGTLIALAADEIVMCEHSVLGPIDPQLGESPAASLIKVVLWALLPHSAESAVAVVVAKFLIAIRHRCIPPGIRFSVHTGQQRTAAASDADF
ncbi:MAG: SDH family Clp fold serine proteinase [Bradyrhizobium sp.]